MPNRYRLLFVALLALVGLGGKGVFAQDPMRVAPGSHTLVLENDKLRVIDFHLKPGEKAAMHSHTARITEVLTGGRIKVTSPAGKSDERILRTGDIGWREAETHAVENIGKTNLHVRTIELKEKEKK